MRPESRSDPRWAPRASLPRDRFGGSSLNCGDLVVFPKLFAGDFALHMTKRNRFLYRINHRVADRHELNVYDRFQKRMTFDVIDPEI